MGQQRKGAKLFQITLKNERGSYLKMQAQQLSPCNNIALKLCKTLNLCATGIKWCRSCDHQHLNFENGRGL